MKIGVVGLRGIPDIQGGVESHCEDLYPLLANRNHEIYIFRRKHYVTATTDLKSWKGVNLIDLPSIHNKYLENICHTFISILKARKLKIDLIHFHGIGPSILIPVAKLLGMKTIVTHHGRDYLRNKWKSIPKLILRIGEKTAFKMADRIIFINPSLTGQIIKAEYSYKTAGIPNGFKPNQKKSGDNILELLNIREHNFILAVGRLVEEKGFHDLLDAFNKSMIDNDIKLVVVGGCDFKDKYADALLSRRSERIIFTGSLTRSELATLYDSAMLFVLPSYHEGLSIALLEAMGHGLPIIASDISANKLPELDDGAFFETGNVDALADKIGNFNKTGRKSYDMGNYDWEMIADKTDMVYRSIENENGGK